jgi:hypothetical protein
LLFLVVGSNCLPGNSWKSVVGLYSWYRLVIRLFGW